jgi:hypothetical protein
MRDTVIELAIGEEGRDEGGWFVGSATRISKSKGGVGGAGFKAMVEVFRRLIDCASGVGESLLFLFLAGGSARMGKVK